MSRTIYDNWERLVGAVLRREEDWQLCHGPSLSSSTRSSNFSFSSHFPDFNPTNFSAYSSSRQQVNVENSSQVSIFRAEQVYVNNEPINSRTVLLSCPNPPTNIISGSYYWYDKNTGFWGKQGYKPSQIISANLNVGGYLRAKASNGNTSVYINEREITKVELRMLKLVGVKCPRDTYFWMYEDGSYEEEGTINIKRSIWSKVGTKLLCSLLSLPFPHKISSHASGDDSKQEKIKKIVLTGYDTINFLKQAIPWQMDMLYYPSLSDMKFSFALPYDDDHDDDNNKLQGYQLIEAPQAEVKESLEMFEDVQVVMFRLSLTDYNLMVVDEDGTYANKMILNKKLFENVATHPSFESKPFLLLLTNYDLFADKIEQSPLNICDLFCEFNPVTNEEIKGNSAIHYISLQFKRLYAAATGRKLYVTKMDHLDKYSVHSALKYAHEILKWGEEMSTYYSSSDESSYSEEDV